MTNQATPPTLAEAQKVIDAAGSWFENKENSLEHGAFAALAAECMARFIIDNQAAILSLPPQPATEPGDAFVCPHEIVSGAFENDRGFAVVDQRGLLCSCWDKGYAEEIAAALNARQPAAPVDPFAGGDWKDYDSIPDGIMFNELYYCNNVEQFIELGENIHEWSDEDKAENRIWCGPDNLPVPVQTPPARRRAE